MFNFLLWIIESFRVSAEGQTSTHEAPQLYMICIIFLSLCVFLVVVCVVLAFVVLCCCCVPCIIPILYALACQKGGACIRRLTKYRFRRINIVDSQRNKYGQVQRTFGGIMIECGSNQLSSQRRLSAEDAECCICLCAYDDGAELRELPCHHHFHCSCVDKWLYLNATCPLCKYNILINNCKSHTSTREEEVQV